MVKSKVRFDGLDVAAMVAHWNRVALGRRVINIYNGPNGDTYLFKLDKGKESSNLLLVIESGIRFHSTVQEYENPGMPSTFCAKLRKHLRGLRLESVQQLGQKDRVVNLIFGSGEQQRHSLILELYARGNLLLTNSSYTILSLLRSHEYSDSSVKVQVGHAYPVTYATTMEVNGNEAERTETFISAENPLEWFQLQKQQQGNGESDKDTGKTKKKKNKGGLDLKTLLLRPQSGISHYGPSLIDHCLLCTNNIDNKKPPKDLTLEDWKELQSVLQIEGDRILKQLDDPNSKGYIFYQPKQTQSINNSDDDEKKTSTSTKNPNASPFHDKLLTEFQPHCLKQHELLDKLEYESFDRAADDFFSHIQSQKSLQRAETQQAQAQQRLEKIRLDQQNRVENLLGQQELLKDQANLVLAHADMVEKAIQVVNSALDNGMDWDQLEDLVQVETVQNQNPVAMLIHKLQLEQDSMVLRLPKEDAEGDEEYMDVTISLRETAHGNASELFAKYRSSKEKSQKTIEASTKALQAAEETAQRQLLEAQKRKKNLSQNLQHKRKPMWFEKFNWFVTTDNYLVLAGRDAQQNEQLVKRYLRPGDAYLHADVHGAASCVLRAKRRRQPNGKTQVLPLSDQALREAGNFTICRSSAWNSRMVTSAWWVESHQVSKTAPTGEYLTVGSFMIRGKKNFLPPTQLEMGLGVLFRLGDDDSVARHKNERRDFALMQMEEDEREGIDDNYTTKEKKVEKKTSIGVGKANSNTPVEEETSLDLDPPTVVSESEVEEELVNKIEAPGSPQHSTNPEVEKGEDAEAHDENKDNISENDEATASTSPDKPVRKEKKGLSVRERKLIKKYGSLEAAQAAEDERKRLEEQKKVTVKSAKKAKGAAQPPQQNNQKRGKKAKMKRMAKKYADQDDEDRELAMLALHAGEKDKKKDKNKPPEISETEMEATAQTMAILKKDSSTVAEKLPPNVRETLAKCVTVKASGTSEETFVRWDKFDADVLEQLQSMQNDDEKLAAAKRLSKLKESSRIDNFSASLAGIIRTIRKYGYKGFDTETSSSEDAKRKTRAEKEAEQESWKQTLAAEGVLDQEIDEDAVDDTQELSKLTGKPHNDDLILFAIPVCAPYHTLSQYVYRVKLTPGNMKRGKASKQCVEMFLKDGQKSNFVDRNKDLIKKVADADWIQSICGDIKISAAGSSKAIQKSKAKNKNRKKK